MIARIAATLVVLFSLGTNAEEGARTPPFITTPDEVVERMLELAGTHRGDLVVDLGSGDGRIVIAAARRFGARGLGIELDARLVEKSRDHARRAQVADRVAFVHGDVLVSDFSQASVVTVYLLPGLIDRLQPRFLGELEPGTRIVSHAFSMVGWKPDRVETVRLARPHPGQGDESTLYLWIVPAEARGLWRGAGSQLKIHQNYQEIEIEGATRASLSGRDISWEADGARFTGRVEGDRISGELERHGHKRPLVLKRLR